VTNDTSIGCTFRRFVAGTVIVCLLATGLPPIAQGGEGVRTETGVQYAQAPASAGEHFLRDAIPAASMALAQPDTTDDDFVLPEEKDNKSLIKEIAIWTLAAAFVAFFIVKVFIEEDDEGDDDDNNGKDVPPPQ
jgi:hypothetical protein